MSRPKQYASNAQRQAAYRRRHVAEKLPTEAELAILARSLDIVLKKAIAQGSALVPASVVGVHAAETLRRLIHYLDPDPDPVRYQGREKPRF